MSLLERIKDRLEFEDAAVAEADTENPVGKKFKTYSVNKHGVVLQFAIAADETDEGVIEDFLEFIEASVSEID